MHKQRARKLDVLIFAWIILSLSIATVTMTTVFGTATTVRVNPAQTTVHVGDIFTVNITLSDVTNLYGWEVWVYWSRTLLNCTQAVPYAANVWGDNNITVGFNVENEYNATHGRYVKAVSGRRPAPPFNGSMTLITLTFKALTIGNAPITLEEVVLADNTIIPRPYPIPHTDYHGSVTVLPPPLYMRSDQHTVNNATMCKLMNTHTGNYNVTSTSSLDPENEWTCYWGVRVWKRSSSGTETEISTDSPVAVVSRSTSGQGTQSATWNCSTTNLTTTDCLVVRVYYKFDVSSWTLCAQFSTVQLNATVLSGQTWTVYYYTSRSYNSPQHKTYMYYYWDNNYDSRIENVNYS